MSDLKLSGWNQRLVDDGIVTEDDARLVEQTAKAYYLPYSTIMRSVLQHATEQPLALDDMVNQAESSTPGTSVPLKQMLEELEN